MCLVVHNLRSSLLHMIVFFISLFGLFCRFIVVVLRRFVVAVLCLFVGLFCSLLLICLRFLLLFLDIGDLVFLCVGFCFRLRFCW